MVGKQSVTGGVSVARASYSRSADGQTTQLDVYGDSKARQDIVVATPPRRRRSRSPRCGREDGRYYAHLDVTGTLPATVEVVNRSDTPQTVKSVPVTDLVTGSATYDATAKTLHVQGRTSDKSSAAGALTVPAFNTTLDATGAGDIAFITPPDSITIKSSKGGAMTVPVEGLQGAALPPLALVANAGPDQTVAQGVTVISTPATRPATSPGTRGRHLPASR